MPSWHPGNRCTPSAYSLMVEQIENRTSLGLTIDLDRVDDQRKSSCSITLECIDIVRSRGQLNGCGIVSGQNSVEHALSNSIIHIQSVQNQVSIDIQLKTIIGGHIEHLRTIFRSLKLPREVDHDVSDERRGRHIRIDKQRNQLTIRTLLELRDGGRRRIRRTPGTRILQSRSSTRDTLLVGPIPITRNSRGKSGRRILDPLPDLLNLGKREPIDALRVLLRRNYRGLRRQALETCPLRSVSLRGRCAGQCLLIDRHLLDLAKITSDDVFSWYSSCVPDGSCDAWPACDSPSSGHGPTPENPTDPHSLGSQILEKLHRLPSLYLPIRRGSTATKWVFFQSEFEERSYRLEEVSVPPPW